MATEPAAIPDRLVLEPERCLMTGVSQSTWYREERAGRAPKARQTVGSRKGWLLSELQEWIKSRPVASNPAPVAANAARRKPTRFKRSA